MKFDKRITFSEKHFIKKYSNDWITVAMHFIGSKQSIARKIGLKVSPYQIGLKCMGEFTRLRFSQDILMFSCDHHTEACLPPPSFRRVKARAVCTLGLDISHNLD
jgi:hypothetical protein